MPMPFELILDAIFQRLTFLRLSITDIDPKNIQKNLPKIFIHI